MFLEPNHISPTRPRILKYGALVHIRVPPTTTNEQ